MLQSKRERWSIEVEDRELNPAVVTHDGEGGEGTGKRSSNFSAWFGFRPDPREELNRYSGEIKRVF